MKGWKRLREFPENERNKLRYLLRNAAENGIVETGVAMKFGREWEVNEEKLPQFLIELTQKKMRAAAA